jgi:hypothetical protein
MRQLDRRLPLKDKHRLSGIIAFPSKDHPRQSPLLVIWKNLEIWSKTSVVPPHDRATVDEFDLPERRPIQ